MNLCDDVLNTTSHQDNLAFVHAKRNSSYLPF